MMMLLALGQGTFTQLVEEEGERVRCLEREYWVEIENKGGKSENWNWSVYILSILYYVLPLIYNNANV